MGSVSKVIIGEFENTIKLFTNISNIRVTIRCYVWQRLRILNLFMIMYTGLTLLVLFIPPVKYRAAYPINMHIIIRKYTLNDYKIEKREGKVKRKWNRSKKENEKKEETFQKKKKKKKRGKTKTMTKKKQRQWKKN